jgi:hypothetical protein
MTLSWALPDTILSFGKILCDLGIRYLVKLKFWGLNYRRVDLR